MDAADFDHEFFNISEEQARVMDPQYRQLLQETWRCVEDAGVTLSELQENETAVFVGAAGKKTSHESQFKAPVFSASDNYHAIVGNRISYAFKFKSHKNNIDAVCPTSVMAIHKARVALLADKCDYAIAAGGEYYLDDSQPHGGVGVLLLQPLMKALEAGRHIYGILRGSQVNLDPNGPGSNESCIWETLLSEVEREAGVSAETLSYMEVQSVKTEDGRSDDFQSMDRVFRRNASSRGFCRLGAQKAHVDPSESGAGILGVIKILMMMRHGVIPASADLGIHSSDSVFSFNPEQGRWATKDRAPMRAGLSSFGIGGVNAHAILEAFPAKTALATHIDEKQGAPFILSAHTQDALDRMIAQWVAFVKTEEFQQMPLNDICATLMMGRQALPYRFGCHVETREELVKALESASAPLPAQPRWGIRIHDLPWNGMIQLQPVLDRNVRFERVINRLIRQFDLDENAFNQPVWREEDLDLFKVVAGYAYLISMTDLGFSPDWLTGQGVGSWVALAASGMTSIRDVVSVLQGRISPSSMKLERPKLPFYDASAGCRYMPFSITADYLNSLLDSLKVSRAELCKYLGKARLLKSKASPFRKALEAWEHELAEAGVSWSLNHGDVLGRGSDSDRLLLMLIIKSSLGDLRKQYALAESNHLKDVRFQELLDLAADGVMSRKMIVALLTGASNAQDIALQMNRRQDRLDLTRPYSQLWATCRNLHEIEDRDAWLSQLTLDPASWSPLDRENVVEVGLPDCAAGEKRLCVSSAKRLPSILLELWLRGVDVQWPSLYPSSTLQMRSLPCYPFAGSHPKRPERDESPVLQPVSQSEFQCCYTPKDACVKDHEINGERYLSPAELLIRSQQALDKAGLGFQVLKDITFHPAVRILGEEALSVHVSESERRIEVSCGSCGSLMDASYARFAPAPKLFNGSVEGGVLQTTHLYENLEKAGFGFGPGLQVIEKAYGSPANLFFDAVIPPGDQAASTLLSACFQAPLIIRFLSESLRPQTLYGPTSMKSLRISGSIPKHCRIVMEPSRVNSSDGKLYTNISAYDQSGNFVLEIRDLVFGEIFEADHGESSAGGQKAWEFSCLVN